VLDGIGHDQQLLFMAESEGEEEVEEEGL